MAASHGQQIAHCPNTLPLATLIASQAPGPTSAAAVAAQARGLHIQLLADARTAEQRGDADEAEALYARLFVHSTDPTLQQIARDALVAAAARDWPAGFRSRFLASLSPAVLSSARVHQVPPSVTLAQAILESGWGRSKLTRDYHNLFGVKAGRSSQRIRLASREHMGGRLRPSRQTFRSYTSRSQSIWDHAELLGTDRRYAHARPVWTEWRPFLEAIAPRYASSPTYVGAVAEIIDLYELDRWDALIVAAVEADRQVAQLSATADSIGSDDSDDTGQPPPFDG